MILDYARSQSEFNSMSKEISAIGLEMTKAVYGEKDNRTETTKRNSKKFREETISDGLSLILGKGGIKVNVVAGEKSTAAGGTTSGTQTIAAVANILPNWGGRSRKLAFIARGSDIVSTAYDALTAPKFKGYMKSKIGRELVIVEFKFGDLPSMEEV